MPTKEEARFFMEAAKLSPEAQAELIAKLSEHCTKAELRAIEIGIGYFRLLLFPALRSAMVEALAREFYAVEKGVSDHVLR